ncbi:MAG TPA: HEAT repeat domain-containing protein [Thermomicrobiales bacterium]|nr:HEAT repeat domain-containing protein [Thermomicrobiales bacterium]
MTTPTSPDRLPDSGAGRLAPTIDAIVGGDFSRSRLAALSDLDRASVSALRQRWLEIPPTERHALLLALTELATESVEFNFNRVCRIALGDPDPVIRQLAIGDLWEDQGPDLPRLYIELLRNDPSDDVRAAAADALSPTTDAIAEGEPSDIDRNELIDLFSSIVEDPAESPLVRRRSLGAIAAFGDDPRIPKLIRLALDEDDQALVAGAIYAMGRTASERWIPELIDYLQSEDAELRFEAARASGFIGDEDVVRELADLVYDPDFEVRTAALEALGAIGGTAAIRVLRQVEEDEEFEESEIVDDALDAALLTVNPLERQS